MTQPGVYFTLDAPYVRVIGLFSNSLEDPGVISSQSDQEKHWPTVPDFQLSYLQAQLETLKKESYEGAVLIAVHHEITTGRAHMTAIVTTGASRDVRLKKGDWAAALISPTDVISERVEDLA